MSNILIINHYARPRQYGGITRHIDFASELVSRGHEVTIFCANQLHLSNQVQKEMIVYEDGVKFVFIKTSGYNGNGIRRFINMISFYANVLKESRKYASFDVVYSSSPHLFTLLAGIKIAPKLSAKNIVEIRDFWPETFIQYGILSKNHPLSVLFRCVERRCYKKSDAIITTAPGMYKYICKYGIPQDKITNINNGVDTDRYEFNLASFDVTSVLDIGNSDTFKIIYAGNHGIANNLDDLIKVVEQLNNSDHQKNIEFFFIGDGSLRQEFVQKISNKALPNVHCHRGIDKKYIPSLYNHADVLVLTLKDLPLYSEYGISINKIYDYLYSGKPVIFLGNPYNDVVTESKGGITISYDGNYINRVCNEILLIQKGQTDKYTFTHSKEFIKNNYSIKCLVDKLEQLF